MDFQAIIQSQYFPFFVGGFVGLAVLIIAWMLFALVNQTMRGYEEGYGDAKREQLEGMFMFIPAQQLLTFKLTCALVGWGLGMIITISAGLIISFLVGMVFSFPFYFLPDKVLAYMYQKRLDMFNDQLVDGMLTLSNALRSGLNFSQGLGILVEEMPNPISQEFNLVLQEIKLGVMTEQALENIARRIPDDDLGILVTAVNIVRGIGGNLAEIFDNIAHVIRERKRIEGKIKAITAQGKLQALIMAAMPLVIALALHFIDPTTLRYLYTTLPGIIIIVVVCLFDYIGYKVILKIVTIDI